MADVTAVHNHVATCGDHWYGLAAMVLTAGLAGPLSSVQPAAPKLGGATLPWDRPAGRLGPAPAASA